MKKETVAVWLFALCFASGLLMVGSDGPMFPLVNVIGVVLFCMCAPLTKYLKEPTIEKIG